MPIFRGLIVAALAAVSTAPTVVLAAAPARPVLMISIDGMRPDAVTEADKHGLRVPNLRRFLTETMEAP